jgi:hypothetical protein
MGWAVINTELVSFAVTINYKHSAGFVTLSISINTCFPASKDE